MAQGKDVFIVFIYTRLHKNQKHNQTALICRPNPVIKLLHQCVTLKTAHCVLGGTHSPEIRENFLISPLGGSTAPV